MLSIVAGGRRSGKSTALIKWTLEGVQCDGYPGWTRVCVWPTVDMDRAMRPIVREIIAKDWAEIDYSHRFYSWPEWKGAVGVSSETEVAIDNAEFLLPQVPGNLRHVSMSVGAVISPSRIDPLRRDVESFRL